MPSKRRDNRMLFNGTLLKRVRLSLFALVNGTTRTAMAQIIINRALSNPQTWKEVQKELKQEAALRGISVEEFIRQRLKEDKFDEIENLDEIDLRILLDEYFEEPEEGEPEE